MSVWSQFHIFANVVLLVTKVVQIKMLSLRQLLLFYLVLVLACLSLMFFRQYVILRHCMGII